MKSEIRNLKSTIGFTLIELLVVITIIVVLLALLTPALDQAVYQAELAVCGANIKGIANGVTQYAVEYGRAYPPRRSAAPGTQPNVIAWSSGSGNDDRIPLRPYASIKALNDPLTGKLDYDNTAAGASIFVPYNVWYGWGFGQNPKKQSRIGQYMEWKEKRFGILVSDYDQFYWGDRAFHSNHPDQEGRMVLATVENGINPFVNNARWYISRWSVDVSIGRSPLDLNFAYQDGSVLRLDGLTANDDTLTVPVPQIFSTEYDWLWYSRLPKE